MESKHFLLATCQELFPFILPAQLICSIPEVLGYLYITKNLSKSLIFLR